MSSLSEHLPPHNPLQQDQRHLPPFGLWGYLSRRTGITPPNPPPSSNANAKSTIPAIAPPLDKAAASTRILLHDTQAHLEKFSERVTQLIAGIADAKRELVAVQKLYQEDHEQLVERMIGLTNRCQAELQKTMGIPAQSSDLRDALRAIEGLGSRLEALDKKVDMISMVGHTQSQTLQSVQDQQGQILAALLPVLPLLQAVPLHVESARNKVMDAISDSKSDVKLSISDLEDRVKQSFGVLGNQIKSSLPQDQVNKRVLALQPRVRDSVSELPQPISTPAEATSPADHLARGTSCSQSGSQKRPRSASPSDIDSSDPAPSPSDSRKRRLGNPSSRAASPARPSHLVSRSALRRIHTPTVPSTTPPSSVHASPDVPLLSAVMRSSDQPVTVRTPLADLDPRTPNTTLNSSTPASTVTVSSIPKQLYASRPSAALRTRPSTSVPAPAGVPPRRSSTQPNKDQAQAPRPSAPAAAPPLSAAATRTPPPTEAARITPGTGRFKLPLPTSALGRTATTVTTPTRNRSTSSFRHPAPSRREKPQTQTRSSRDPMQPLASRSSRSSSSTQTFPLGLAASREVAVLDTPNGPAHAFGVVDMGVSGVTPRTPRLPVDASTTDRVALPSLPPLPPPPPMLSAGKPMSLRDRRAMLPEDRLRDEGKRFIPLDDEEDDDVEMGMAG